MAGESDKKSVGDTVGDVPPLSDTEKTKEKKKKKGLGLLARVWNGILRQGEDLEKRLQHISKEEAATLSRLKWRAQWWRKMTRHFIVFSILLEVVAVGYAIMTTRSSVLNWKSRALCVLPMFLWPAISFAIHWVAGSITRMRDNRDRKTLERLREERQARIDELKEKTNYYTTQQLIQRYDTDPAAKAAAATVLASKLGADSGLKVYLGDESRLTSLTGKSSDVELAQTGGLRNRKQLHTRANSPDGTLTDHPEVDMLDNTGVEEHVNTPRNQMAVEHFQPTGPSTHDQGWLAKFAALLVGEDPSQSYALICGDCRMHNGLARKEDFPYVTYYCPHCNALNRPKNQDERFSGSSTPNVNSSVADSTIAEEVTKNSSSSTVDGVPTGSPAEAAAAAAAAAAADTETDKTSPEASCS